jgi:hypothetical protein
MSGNATNHPSALEGLTGDRLWTGALRALRPLGLTLPVPRRTSSHLGLKAARIELDSSPVADDCRTPTLKSTLQKHRHVCRVRIDLF